MLQLSPPKLVLFNLLTDERLNAQFNPTDLELTIKATYKKQIVPGMSHTPLQYSHSEGLSFPLELRFQVQALSVESTEVPFTLDDRQRVEGFLLALTTPNNGMGIIGHSAPPSVLVVWPNFLSLEAVVESISFKYSRFNAQMHPVELTASLTLEEVRNMRYTSERARVEGFQRYALQERGDF
jgi:hypothetical protein